jgi:hypothetical protein
MNNFSVPPPFSNTPCICPVIDTNHLSCHPWGAKEWLICSSILSTFAGVSITLLTLYINKLKKVIPERERMRTDLNTINENDSIPEIMVIQR